MTPEQYLVLSNNEPAAAAVLHYWAQENTLLNHKNHVPRFSTIKQDGEIRYVMAKSNARSLFTESFESFGDRSDIYNPWNAYTSSYKHLLDDTTRYQESPDSLRIKRALQVNLEGYASMTSSIKLLTPKDIFILMTVTPANKFNRAGMWREFIGIGLMKGRQAASFWNQQHGQPS